MVIDLLELRARFGHDVEARVRSRLAQMCKRSDTRHLDNDRVIVKKSEHYDRSIVTGPANIPSRRALVLELHQRTFCMSTDVP